MAMRSRNLKLALGALVIALLVGGGALAWYDSREDCCAVPENAELGLMTSLPLYWPEGSQIADIAGGQAELPWQRTVLERSHSLLPLDTLSPIPALSPNDPPEDPLAGLDRLAIVQPRGLSPADNVALDDWVRAGGRLLLVLDPMLTGHYDYGLGDPRRPSDVALIPPVVARWGLEMNFDEAQSAARPVEIDGRAAPLELAGSLREIAGSNADCMIEAADTLALCTIGEGRVTLFADAALFEGEAPDEAKSAAIQSLLEIAFE